MVKILNSVIFIITVALVLSGCAKKKEETLSIPSDFQPYVSDFEATSARVGAPLVITDLIMEWGDLRVYRERAHAEITDGETPKIVVDTTAWARLNPVERRALIFHELGHAILRRKHYDPQVKTQAKATGACPVSVMATYPILAQDYESCMPNLDDELFNNKSAPRI